MRKYRKKPVVIEAVVFEYSEEGIRDLREFCGNSVGMVSKARHPSAVGEAIISTLEDGADGQATHIATEGDFIIKGIEGEFYPCKPSIFRQTYEEL